MALQDKIKLFINNPWKIIEYLHVKADLVILNYLDENILAASGPLSLAIAHEKPVIATKMPRFLEYRDYMLLIKPNDKEELRKAVEMILLNQKSCKALKRKMKILKQQHNWSSIAKKHINLYLKTVK
jgi:glycosyltransferase involved in cell wall biosynthesis